MATEEEKMTRDAIRRVIDENIRLREKLQEDEEYREYVQKHRLKGYVSGYLTRCAGHYIIDHRSAEFAERTQAALRKLARNPALSAEAQETLDNAGYLIRMYMLLKEQYYSFLDGETGGRNG